MFHRRILYLLTLAAVLVFQITNSNYLARFLLALCLALPILSLILSIAGMRGCRLSLSARPNEVQRGGEAQWFLSAETRSGLPIPRLTVRLEMRNLLTGQREKKKLTLSGVVRRRPIPFAADTAHCGLLEFRVTRFKVFDYLGLFSIRRPLPEPARLLAEPVPLDPGPLNLPEGQGQRKPAGATAPRGRSEDYDLREYRPGDPMRSVHWKLSSKWDELVVKEGMDQLQPFPLLTFDHFGAPEEFDRTLDRLAGYSHALLAVQRPHGILWVSCDGVSLYTVSTERDLRDCLLAVCGERLPASGASILEQPELIRGPDGPVFHLHMDAREEDAP